MEDWKETTLSEIADVVMGQSPSSNTCNSNGSGAPLLNGPTEFGSSYPKAIQFTIDGKKFAHAGDLLFCVRGSTTGRMNWADKIYAIGRGLSAIRHKKGTEYKYYLKGIIDFNLPDLLAAATGSTFPHVSRDQILGMKISVPSLDYQRSINDILSALDDKIELNRQMNATLEATARALFKSWFVDFDPVRAKMEGRQPEGLSAELTSLFPDSVMDGKPNGWLDESVYSYADYINGASFKNMYFSNDEGAMPVVKIAELKNGVGKGTNFTCANLGNKYLIHNGEVLFSWSGSPETSIDIFLWVGGMAWLNQHIFKVVTKSTEMRTFVFFLLKHLKSIFIAIAKDKQTTGLGHVTIQDLKKLKFTHPDNKVLKAFSEVATPILNNIQDNLEQIAILSNLKDQLLPKLISGELRVENFHEVIQDKLETTGTTK